MAEMTELAQLMCPHFDQPDAAIDEEHLIVEEDRFEFSFMDYALRPPRRRTVLGTIQWGDYHIIRLTVTGGTDPVPQRLAFWNNYYHNQRIKALRSEQ
jgi:hypothetical protein